jgi:hypothetical protein
MTSLLLLLESSLFQFALKLTPKSFNFIVEVLSIALNAEPTLITA